MSDARPNAAAWVDRVLRTHWPVLERRLGSSHMPSVEKMGRRGPVAQQLGCGHYGCVMPTGEKGLVFKLTTDGTEASFVSQAMSLRPGAFAESGGFPEGIVRYYALYQLEDAQHRNRPVYALLREEASDVGALAKRREGVEADAARIEYRALRRLTQFRWWAGRAREKLARAQSPLKTLTEARGMRPWAAEAVDYSAVDDYQLRDAFLDARRDASPEPRGLTGARAIAYEVRACEIIAEQMAEEDGGYLIGRAFSHYLEHDILLADVHGQNVGRVARDGYARPVWAITDPGHMMPLSAKRMEFAVETLA